MEKKNKPEIRFKWSKEEWKKHAFIEVTNLLTGYPFSSKQFIDKGILLVRGMNVKRGFLDVSESAAEYWPTLKGLEMYSLQEEDIVIQMDGALIGKSYAKIEAKHLPALLVQRVTRLRADKKIGDLIYQYIQRDFLRYINSIKTETAVPHLSLNDIRTFTVSLPTNIDECYKTGSFLSNLDKLITQHQQKHSKLQALKKAMLGKMFPKQGQRVPEIRFKGFKGDWDEKNFEEVFLHISNNSLSRDNLNYNSGRARNVHYGDILVKFNEILDMEKEVLPFITNEALVAKFKGNFLRDGDIIFSDAAEDETVGKCVELLNVKNENILSGLHTIAVRPKKKFSSMYLGFYLNSNSYHSQLIKLMQGTKVLSLSKTAIKNTIIQFPTESDEQLKIGNYFKNLDQLIDNQEVQITKLQNIKKALLAKMLV
jgi:type I restriction enzyme, S subunit